MTIDGKIRQNAKNDHRQDVKKNYTTIKNIFFIENLMLYDRFVPNHNVHSSTSS